MIIKTTIKKRNVKSCLLKIRIRNVLKLLPTSIQRPVIKIFDNTFDNTFE